MKSLRPLFFLSATVLLSCQGNNTETKNAVVKDSTNMSIAKHNTTPYSPHIPNSIGSEKEKAIYVVKNYWNDFNFADTSIISSGYGEQAIVDFISTFPHADLSIVRNGFKNLLAKSNNSQTISTFFISQFDRYLYDGNSPLYNDLYYEAFLRELLAAKSITENQKMLYETRLKLVSRNQQGTKAANFVFNTLKSSSSLYDVEAEYVLLMFYEPGCPACEHTIKTFQASAGLNQLIENKTVKLLAIYPEGVLETWSNYQQNIPSTWINGYDANQKVINQGLYDLKASPTLYLLDAEKKVILKDAQVARLFQVLQIQ